MAQYVRAYEDRATIDQAAARNEDDRLIYFKLKWLHEIENWEYLNEIGKYTFASLCINSAFMCLAESLRLNPNQFDIHQTACRLFENVCRDCR